jgi:hypothetical protein
VSRGGARRRIRVRRKRRDESGLADGLADGAAEFGCCLFEVVIGATVFVGVLAVPVWLIG